MLKKILLLFLLVFLVNLSPAKAIQFDIPKDELDSGDINLTNNVEDNYFAAGNQLIIESRIDGDAFLFGNSVRFTGETTNNLFSGAQSIDISGKIGRDLFTGSSSVIIDKDAVINGNVYIGSGSAKIKGTILGDVYIGSGNLTISGTVNGNIIGQSDNFTLSESANVLGKITYSSKKDINIVTGAKYKDIEKKNLPTNDNYTQNNWFSLLMSLLGLLLVGVLIITFFPKKTLDIVENISTKFLPSLGWGFFMLIATPVLIIISFSIMIGFPLAIILIGLYWLSIYLSNIYVGIYLGKLLTKNNKSLLWALTLGVILLFIVVRIPWIGSLLMFIVTLLGLGGIYLTIKDNFNKNKN